MKTKTVNLALEAEEMMTEIAIPAFGAGVGSAYCKLKRKQGDWATAASAVVLRMEGGEGSVAILSPVGEQFTINFMKDYVNATNRESEARLDGDTWIVTIDGAEVYEVPRALIEGG